MTLPPVSSPAVPDAGHRAGAVTAIGYTASYHREMTPALLSLSLLLRGVAPPDFGRAFTWCELGFGQGVNLAVAAATHPQGRFFGTDVNPEHAAHAAGLARAAGLGNLAVEALDFDAYDRLDLPPFDVVALHGVWSWVGEGPRRRIVDFLRRRLKPGGVAYVSYNALPGWAPYMPLRRLLTAHAAQGQGAQAPLPERIAAALGFLRRLAREGGYFAVNPAVLPRLEELAERPAAYLAHEFFNAAWTPDYSADVFAALTGADLSFAAPALASDHADVLPEGARALLAEVADPALRETVRDTLTNQPFRRDVFVRGPRTLDPAERDRRLDALPFAALAPARTLPGIARLPHGELPLDRDAGMALLEALADGPASLEALAARAPEVARLGRARLRAALVQLHALARIAPAPGGEAMGAAGSDAWNRLVLARSLDGDTLSALASPVLAGAVETDRLERLFLLASVRGVDPAAFAWSVLAARGEAVLRDGRLLEGEAANRTELAERAAAFRRARLPLLARLGCVPSRT
ncbi:class I SAM-dependent methyltransferase [Rhodospirillum centenum]|uniref:Methyltransferase n=1 Tax=Rhodospirillum centenum (strain ATCC 51521 / SW) TaxID=414684 RepID=B6IV93_RHOCS|nr:class I SAM-dependent methyltransferase [Rhodospirillum centenum]ACJ00217.1 conserved hypothetical protein [Rhodospirillum centenum SW]